MRNLRLPVIVTSADGYFTAEVPVLPACVSQGKTREEALANIKETAIQYLETMGEFSCELSEHARISEMEVSLK